MTKGKPPAFQFYPGDWLSNVKLQSCSMRAQGVLVNLMCCMHQSERYGFLLINGSKPNHKQIKNITKMHQKSFNHDIKMLLNAGVLKEKDGILYSPRMVRDEALREKRREFGKLGGNPNLVKHNVNPKVNPLYPPLPLQSSSSSPEGSCISSESYIHKDTPRENPAVPGTDDRENDPEIREPSRPPNHWDEEDIKSKAWEVQATLELGDEELPAITNLICNFFSGINPALTATRERMQAVNEGRAERIENVMAYFTHCVKNPDSLGEDDG